MTRKLCLRSSAWTPFALALVFFGCSSKESSSNLRTSGTQNALASDPAFWADSYSGHNESERCVTSADPFNAEHPADLGRCLWRQHYRPVVKVSKYGQEAFQLFEDGEHMVVANVRHFDKFYVARIPFKKTTHLNMLRVVSIMPVLGNRGSHGELRAYFSEKIKLIPQWPLDPAGAFWVDQLVFTGNPVGAEELSRRNARNNIDGSVLHACGIHTIDSKIKEHFVDFPSETEAQVRLNLNEVEREEYIKLYINLANTQRFGRHFLLNSLNCTFSQFEVLDAVLKHRYNAASTPFDPISVYSNLEKRKLIDHSVHEPNIEDEERAQILFKTYPRVMP
jgi:hypothetical protein